MLSRSELDFIDMISKDENHKHELIRKKIEQNENEVEISKETRDYKKMHKFLKKINSKK